MSVYSLPLASLAEARARLVEMPRPLKAHTHKTRKRIGTVAIYANE
jgi:hypothetical protein